MSDDEPRYTPEASLFDADDFLARLDGDRELFREVIEIFMDEAPVLILQMGARIEQGDLKTAQQAAHTLKGASANISAKQLQALAHRFEQACRRRDMETAVVLYGRIKTAYRELRERLVSCLVA